MGAPSRDIAQAKDFIALPGYSMHRPEATRLYQLGAEVVALPSQRFPGDLPAAAILRYTTTSTRKSSGESADP